MKVNFELTRTGILAIAAAGIVAAGAVAERANRLYGAASPAEPTAAGKTAVAATADGHPAELRSRKPHRR